MPSLFSRFLKSILQEEKCDGAAAFEGDFSDVGVKISGKNHLVTRHDNPNAQIVHRKGDIA